MVTRLGVTATTDAEEIESCMANPAEPAGMFRVRLPVSVLPILMDELGSVTAIIGTAGEPALKAVLNAAEDTELLMSSVIATARTVSADESTSGLM
jgi:hypothetical protein